MVSSAVLVTANLVVVVVAAAVACSSLFSE
jgi:hypothetical protein